MRRLIVLITLLSFSAISHADLFEDIVKYDLEAVGAYLANGGDPSAKVQGETRAMQLASQMYGEDDDMVALFRIYQQNPSKALIRALDIVNKATQVFDATASVFGFDQRALSPKPAHTEALMRVDKGPRIRILVALLEGTTDHWRESMIVELSTLVKQLSASDIFAMGPWIFADLVKLLQPDEATCFDPEFFAELIDVVAETPEGLRFGKARWTRAEFMAAILRLAPHAIAHQANRHPHDEEGWVNTLEVLQRFEVYNGVQAYGDVYALLNPNHPVADFIAESLK